MRRLWLSVSVLATAAMLTAGMAEPASANLANRAADCNLSADQDSVQIGEGASYSASMALKATYTGLGPTDGKNDQYDGCKDMAAANPIDFFGDAGITLRLPKVIAGHSYPRPTAKSIMRSVRAAFAADSRVGTSHEKGTTVNGEISVSKQLVVGTAGVRRGNRYVYKVLGGSRNLKVPAGASQCGPVQSAGADWTVICTVAFPYNTWTYRQPVGRVAGGFRTFTVRFALAVRYAGTTFHAPIAFPLKADS